MTSPGGIIFALTPLVELSHLNLPNYRGGWEILSCFPGKRNKLVVLINLKVYARWLWHWEPVRLFCKHILTELQAPRTLSPR